MVLFINDFIILFNQLETFIAGK